MKTARFVSVVGFAPVFVALVLSGCSRTSQTPPQAPIAGTVEQNVAATGLPSVNPNIASTNSINVQITLNKAQIFNREFMYNLDLQYSSVHDSLSDTYTQSLAAALIPVYFRVAGDELQLVSNEKLKYQSNVNHPEQLVSRFKILKETDDTLVVSQGDSSTYLAMVATAATDGTSNQSVIDHWVRSFNYDANGNYVLQETTIELPSFDKIEFAEAIFPRENLKPGSQFQKLQLAGSDADTDVAPNFRFLNSDPIYNGEDQVAYAQKFDISPNADGTPGTIDWYVTPNIPDEFVEPVKLAVEGWNRYFLKMKGIERNVMRFMGKLPDGIHLGDPRYNVINWDSRLVAGAAYESQSSDPETGKQAHSVIYMPAAWFTIGAKYWIDGVSSDNVPNPLEDELASKPKKTRSIVSTRSACGRDLREASQLLASGRIPQAEVISFGIELLKQSLFHEVGHALGLAHNFKGSLEYDPSKPGSIFSSSIMDYNNYELERAAFEKVDSANGPLLEYDRQAISVLYNNHADIANGDRQMPACEDSEADNETGGVDPLCIRYDQDNDPTLSVTMALNRVTQSKLTNDVTLEEAISRLPTLMISDAQVQAATSQQAVQILALTLARTLRGTLNFYYLTGGSSVSSVVRKNVKSLLVFSDALPDGYDEKAMRERAFDGVQKSVAITQLPDNVRTAIVQAVTDGVTRIGNTPFLQALPDPARLQILNILGAGILGQASAIEKDSSAGLPAMRAKILLGLARHTAVPFFLGKAGDAQLDFETAVVALLTEKVVTKTGTPIERLAAAKALATYKGRRSGNGAIDSIKAKLVEERAAAADNVSLETIEKVLAALGLNS